jgi:tetratricopeptide (TPR) repeat protein
MDLKEKLEKANCLKNDGKLKGSLELYNEAFNLLVEEARNYASKTEKVFQSEEKNEISPGYLKKFNEYLKKDRQACAISNNMGVLFAQMGEKASAKVFFEQAIDLTPKGEKYDDPFIGLEVLKSKQ